MTRRRNDATAADWDEERIALRITLHIGIERCMPTAERAEIEGRIAALDKKIASSRMVTR